MFLKKIAAVAVLGASILGGTAMPTPVQAHYWHGGGAFVGGLVAGAVVGGAVAAATAPRYYAPRAYYGPGCGYYPYPPCAPVYAPAPYYGYPRY